jgi:hypothetical protein
MIVDLRHKIQETGHKERHKGTRDKVQERRRHKAQETRYKKDIRHKTQGTRDKVQERQRHKAQETRYKKDKDIRNKP